MGTGLLHGNKIVMLKDVDTLGRNSYIIRSYSNQNMKQNFGEQILENGITCHNQCGSCSGVGQ